MSNPLPSVRPGQSIIRFYRNVELAELEQGWAEVSKDISDDIAAMFPEADCKAGCSACCSTRVELMPTEAHRLVDHVRRNLPPEDRQRILDGIKVRAMVAGSVPPHEYFSHGLPCVFLGADGNCTVYDIRPLMCRAFGSTSAAYCRGEEPATEEKGMPTFTVQPESMLGLVATSGLWWVEMNTAMLGTWTEGGVKVAVPVNEVMRTQAAQAVVEAATAPKRKVFLP